MGFCVKVCNYLKCYQCSSYGRNRVIPDAVEPEMPSIYSQELKDRAALIVADVIKSASERYRNLLTDTPTKPAAPTTTCHTMP